MPKTASLRQRVEEAQTVSPLTIHLLGGFRVWVGSEPVSDDAWRLRKAAALVKLLSLADNHRLHREQIMELLWPDLDLKAASNNLHHVLHNARRIIQPNARRDSAFLRLQQDQLSLGPVDLMHVDVQAFERAAGQARGSGDAGVLRSALSLYTGDLLPEDPYEDWAADRREGLKNLQFDLLLQLGSVYERGAEFGLAIDTLQRAIAADPLSEDAHAHLMRLYARSGQRHQALRQFDRMKQLLEKELDVQPSPAVQELYEQICEGRVPTATEADGSTAAVPAVDQLRNNLPVALTSFVGRDREILEIKRLLSSHRLLTITGAGGAGKTRLALQAAAEVLADFSDGVWLVELASISDPALLTLTVARVLDFQERTDEPIRETVVNALRSKKLLLLLDNCEHMVEESAVLVDAILNSCPLVKVLITSREPLSIQGEVTQRVPPLAFPDPDHLPGVDQLVDCDSVRLFLERVQYRQPDFLLTPHNAAAVAQICKQVEGIPLAIELAAARVGVLSVEQIATRLYDVLALLTGGSRTAPSRQRTLRGALDWSYELLTGPEKGLLDRLSVFAGGWDLYAAEHISGPRSENPIETLELLSRLVDKSLVAVEAQPRGDVRYRLLEPVRQYSAARLAETSQVVEVEDLHMRFFISLVLEAESELTAADQAKWLDRLEMEHDNLRKALAHAVESHQEEHALTLAASLWRFWFIRGHLTEGRRHLETLLRLVEGRDKSIDPTLLAKAFNAAGALAYYQSDFEKATAFYERALTLRRELADKSGVARSLSNLGLVFKEQGDYERAESLYLESLELQKDLGDQLGIASALNNLGIAAMDQGDYERAADLHRQSLQIKRSIQDQASIVYSLNNLGAIALDLRNFEEAQSLLEEGLELARQLKSKRSMVTALTNLGRLACDTGKFSAALERYRESFVLLKELGETAHLASCLEAAALLVDRKKQPERAIRILAHAESLRETMRSSRPLSEEVRYNSLLLDLRHAVSRQVFDDCWAEGLAMSDEEATDQAIFIETEQTDTASALTSREREIAALMARGYTNRQIAEELTIAVRTVDTHVVNILGKLGVDSRSEVSNQL